MTAGALSSPLVRTWTQTRHATPKLPPKRLLSFSVDDVRAVEYSLLKSGVIEAIEQMQAESRRGPGGRAPSVTFHALLVGLFLAALSGSTRLTDVFEILYFKVPSEVRSRLGIAEPPDDVTERWLKSRYRTVCTAFERLVALMDPSDLPKNRRVDAATFAELTERKKASRIVDHDEAERRLEWVLNAILEASLVGLPFVRRQHSVDGSVAIDGTKVPAFARPDRRIGKSKTRAKRELVTSSADPDAGFYRPDGDHNGNAVANSSVHMDWAYELSIAVSVNSNPSAPIDRPALVMAMAPLGVPGADPGLQAIRALRSLSERGYRPGYLVVDNLYPNQKPEKFQIPARELGYAPVFEYTERQRSVQADAHGAKQVEGKWYCPSMPEALVEASNDRALGKISESVFRDRIEARKAYEFREHSQADSDGSQRFLCPAAGVSPTVKCPQKPKSLLESKPLQIVPKSKRVETFPPKCCRQETITIAADMGAKLKQELHYASPMWEEIYRTGRATNEGMNGQIKRATPINVAEPNLRRVRGITAQSVLVAFQLGAMNMRKIRQFDESLKGDPEQQKHLEQRAKRKQKSRPYQPRRPRSAKREAIPV